MLLFTSVTEIAEVLLPVELETLAVDALDADTEATEESVEAETETATACSAPKNQDVATG